MKPKEVELKEHIQSQIQNYEEFLQLITRLQTSHAWVFRRMDVIVFMHVIQSIGTPTKEKTNNQVLWKFMNLHIRNPTTITGFSTPTFFYIKQVYLIT